MLGEKGGTGFPTLMFLDAEGRRLGKHAGPRTPSGFEESLEGVEEFQSLREKAEAGDAKAAAEVLIRQLELEWFGLEEAQKRADALEKLSGKQKKQVAQLLIDTEVRDLSAKASESREERQVTGAHFAAMFEDDRIPATQTGLIQFWTIMADYAEKNREKKLFKKIVGEFEDTVKSGARSRKTLKDLEARLDDFPKK
jgi:hypothetical protein